MDLKKRKEIVLFAIVTFFILILTLTACMNIPLPSKPKISFSPAVPVAGQDVTVLVNSKDDYSDVQYSVSVDGNALSGNPNTGVFHWIAEEGVHTFIATAVDAYNNAVGATATLKVNLPPPPNIKKIAWYPSSPIGGEEVDFEVEATSIIGIEDLSIGVDSNSLKTTKNGNAYEAKWEAIPGEHTLRITAKDTRGTTNSTQVTLNVGPYPFPKIRSFTWSPQNPTMNDKEVVFKVVGEDPSGFYASIAVDGKDLNTVKLSTSTAIATWDVSVGYHEVVVRLEDSKGWDVKQVHHISILPPQSDLNVQIGIIPKSPKHDDKVTVKAFASDSYAPIQTMILFVDGAKMAQVATNTLTYTFFPSDGNHEITVKAVDMMNEKTSSNLFFNVAFDPQMYPPSMSVKFTKNATVGVAKILSVFATSTAPNSFIKKVSFVNMINSSLIGEVDTGSNGVFSVVWTPLKAGYIPILVNAVDSYNTVSSTVVMMNVVTQPSDENAPLIQPAFKSLIKQSSRVTLCASVVSKNEIKRVNMWVDEVPITPFKKNDELYCVDWIANATGTHTFTVSAQDVYDHESTQTFYFYVYPSKLPVVRLRMKSKVFYVGNEVMATADILKSTSQIDHVNFYVDGVLKDTQYQPPYVFKEKAREIGTHTLTVEAVDIYANKGYAQLTFIVEKDETPPYLQISAPSTVASGENVKVKITTFDRESGVKTLKIDVYSSKSPKPYPGIIPIFSKTFSYPSTYTSISFNASEEALYKVIAISKDTFGNKSVAEKDINVK